MRSLDCVQSRFLSITSHTIHSNDIEDSVKGMHKVEKQISLIFFMHTEWKKIHTEHTHTLQKHIHTFTWHLFFAPFLMTVNGEWQMNRMTTRQRLARWPLFNSIFFGVVQSAPFALSACFLCVPPRTGGDLYWQSNPQYLFKRARKWWIQLFKDAFQIRTLARIWAWTLHYHVNAFIGEFPKHTHSHTIYLTAHSF